MSLLSVWAAAHTPRSNEEAIRTGDWKWQNRMMDAMISAFESSLVGFK